MTLQWKRERQKIRQAQTNPLRTEVALQNLEWVTNFGLDADSLKSHPGESATNWHKKDMQFMDVCLCLWVFIWILNDSYVIPWELPKSPLKTCWNLRPLVSRPWMPSEGVSPPCGSLKLPIHPSWQMSLVINGESWIQRDGRSHRLAPPQSSAFLIQEWWKQQKRDFTVCLLSPSYNQQYQRLNKDPGRADLSFFPTKVG